MSKRQNESQISGPDSELEYLLSTAAINERCAKVLKMAESGGTHFKVDFGQMDALANYVAAVTRENYPDLKIPFHSRWRHFDAGGVARNKMLEQKLSTLTPEERIKSRLDLVVASVLLDAGAGTSWGYQEKSTGSRVARSEGLAVASLHMFLEGGFSSNPANPYQVDAAGLAAITRETLARAFQVNEKNPLVGLDGRLGLLHSLGRVLKTLPAFFGKDAAPRIGNILSPLQALASQRSLRATQILTTLQKSLGSIWPGRVMFGDFNLGDVWPYAPLGSGAAGLIPFHKLSQWLTLSMVDPLEESGLKITHFEELTGLPEYRNGGLFIDLRLLVPRQASDLQLAHEVDSEFIVEWRALTVALLSDLAPRVRKLLGKSETELPLGKILEGGTWAAGRKIAKELRADASSPLKIISDGTVF